MIIQTNKELKDRAEFDHYPTPAESVKAYLNTIPLEELFYNPFNPLYILDVGAETGIWGKCLLDRVGRECRRMYGVEYQDKYPIAQSYDEWFTEDFLSWQSPVLFDIVLGNPPYGKDVDGNIDKKYAEKIIKKSWDILKPNGLICFLLRLNFLEGIDRGDNFWPVYKPCNVYVSTRRPSFTGNRKTDSTAYAFYIWQKGANKPCILEWVKWDYEK